MFVARLTSLFDVKLAREAWRPLGVLLRIAGVLFQNLLKWRFVGETLKPTPNRICRGGLVENVLEVSLLKINGPNCRSSEASSSSYPLS